MDGEPLRSNDNHQLSVLERDSKNAKIASKELEKSLEIQNVLTETPNSSPLLGSKNQPDTRQTDKEIKDNGRSQLLRSQWYGLDKDMTSFMRTLITTGDLRRQIMHNKEALSNQAQAFLRSSSDPIAQEILEERIRLHELEDRLQNQDENLVAQADAIIEQASRIFGAEADGSFRILDEQGVAVQSHRTSTDDSVFDPDDIRKDQGSEVLQYLSKKRDVDQLKEELLELEAERGMLLSAAGESKDIQYLESRVEEVLRELSQAEEDLTALHDKLPERKVVIPQDQLLEASEQLETPSTQNKQNKENLETEGEKLTEQSPLGAEAQAVSSFSRILDDATQDDADGSEPFVKAYLFHQRRQAQEEYAKAAEQAKKDGGPSVDVYLEEQSIRRWFDEERPTRSGARNTAFSQGYSNKTDIHTAAHIQDSPRSEPIDLRKASGAVGARGQNTLSELRDSTS